MANYVIVGAGASGLYTAYRLLTGGTLNTGDTVCLYEWSQRPGGRIYTYTFPEEIGGQTGLYAEFGGMRFATDKAFPGTILEGHVLVQNMIVALNLQNLVVPFEESPQRMYYLRGTTQYENGITSLSNLPYQFSKRAQAFIETAPQPWTADNILGQIATVFAPNLGSSNADRGAWCDYYGGGTIGSAQGTPTFPAGVLVANAGYWNLLYDQLGDEGYDYCADATGYTSNVINWNSADAMQANNDYGSSIAYSRLDGGYSILFETLADAVTEAAKAYPGSGIFYGAQLLSLSDGPETGQTICSFFFGAASGNFVADQLFLAMPRRALELVANNCSPSYLLNAPPVKYALESAIDQPAIKAILVFDEAWWAPSAGYCLHPPILAEVGPNQTQWVGGPTITDLPLRMVYYFGNNVPGGPGQTGGPYVLLASYDDMTYSNFWRELETDQLYANAPSMLDQPLYGPTQVTANGPMAQTLMNQLAEVHGADVNALPTPTAVYFQDWGQNPYGGGYHGWSAHYDICTIMAQVRAPSLEIMGGSANLYIIGSCYSFDQAWVEGAFCTAESVLQDYLHLGPFIGRTDYTLICKP